MKIKTQVALAILFSSFISILPAYAGYVDSSTGKYVPNPKKSQQVRQQKLSCYFDENKQLVCDSTFGPGQKPRRAINLSQVKEALVAAEMEVHQLTDLLIEKKYANYATDEETPSLGYRR